MYQYQVSVIVCTYNSKWEKLKSTLLSILSQRDISFEIIIADDGSEIQCLDRAKKYFEKSDSLIKKFNRKFKFSK